MVVEERCVEQVYANNAESFLLQAVLVVQHADVEDNLAVLIPRMRLIFHAHPTVALIGPLKISRRHRIRERKESGAVTAQWP